jgi:hypothetical protein
LDDYQVNKLIAANVIRPAIIDTPKAYNSDFRKSLSQFIRSGCSRLEGRIMSKGRKTRGDTGITTDNTSKRQLFLPLISQSSSMEINRNVHMKPIPATSRAGPMFSFIYPPNIKRMPVEV